MVKILLRTLENFGNSRCEVYAIRARKKELKTEGPYLMVTPQKTVCQVKAGQYFVIHDGLVRCTSSDVWGNCTFELVKKETRVLLNAMAEAKKWLNAHGNWPIAKIVMVLEDIGEGPSSVHQVTGTDADLEEGNVILIDEMGDPADIDELDEVRTIDGYLYRVNSTPEGPTFTRPYNSHRARELQEQYANWSPEKWTPGG